MRRKIVAGNWKMYKTYEEGLKLASEVVNMANEEWQGNTEVVLCAPFINLHGVSILCKGRVSAGAQNCYPETEGAYTGEVSAPMVASSGAKYVIIGHSERREYFDEQGVFLCRKMQAALKAGLTPIFCCGEPKDIREAGRQDDFVKFQIDDVLGTLSPEEMKRVVVAYEPVWAIGTGLTATSQQAQDMHKNIRQILAQKFGEDIAANTSILYGGSVKPANAEELFSMPDVDGGLVGGASLKASDFIDIVKAMKG